MGLWNFLHLRRQRANCAFAAEAAGICKAIANSHPPYHTPNLSEFFTLSVTDFLYER